MKLGVSNLAWKLDDEAKAFALLARYGFQYVEIAATKIWGSWENITPRKIAEYKAKLSDFDLKVSGLQSITFGVEGVAICGSRREREKLQRHILSTIEIAQNLGAAVLVFGSPSLRMFPFNDETFEQAATFFTPLAKRASSSHTCICLEPLPPQYGCEFGATCGQVKMLVDRISESGFGFHIDSGAAWLSGESPSQIAIENAASLRHFHISEPFLKAVSDETQSHREVGRALQSFDYPHCAIVEMMNTSMQDLETALIYVGEAYGNSEQ